MKKVLCTICMLIHLVSHTKAQSPGDIIVTEFMANPSLVADNLGEWFEILNVSANTIDINKWRIKDSGTNNHIINNLGPLLIAPGAILVLGINNVNSTNGGLTVNYKYTGFTLANTSDEIILTDSLGTVIDVVAYSSSSNGKSWNLDPSHYTAIDNDNFTYWCLANSMYGLGDFGTPNSTNSNCGLSRLTSIKNEAQFLIQKTENEIRVSINAALKNQKWQILDVSGKIILSGSTANKPIVAIPLEKMNAGIYFFRWIEAGYSIKLAVD